jgi:hypothetical protein
MWTGAWLRATLEIMPRTPSMAGELPSRVPAPLSWLAPLVPRSFRAVATSLRRSLILTGLETKS